MIGAGLTVTTRGILNASRVHSCDVFLATIVATRAALVLYHDCPSGDATPSPDDRAVTDPTVAAGQLLDVTMGDHLIVGHGRLTSFAEAGMTRPAPPAHIAPARATRLRMTRTATVSTMVYGVLGVGVIGAAIATGLCDGVDRPPTVLLSPRNARLAAGLAARLPTVRVAPDNQRVVDGADVVVLCLRPHDAREALAAVRFRPEQPVVSAMAGVSITELATLVAPAHELSRVIPLPSVARRSGMTPVLPPGAPAAHVLFAALGGAFDVPDADAFDALSAATSTLSTYFAYFDAIARWLSAHGIAEPHATRYVASVFTGLSAELPHARDFAQLARDHTTPGGINAQLHDFLQEAGAFDHIGVGLDRVYDRLHAARTTRPA